MGGKIKWKNMKKMWVQSHVQTFYSPSNIVVSLLKLKRVFLDFYLEITITLFQ